MAMEAAKEYTDIIGGSGRFQFTILAFCFFCAAPHCLHNFCITFYAPNFDYWCARPEEAIRANISVKEWKNSSVPVIKSRTGVEEYSHCTMFNSTSPNDSFYYKFDTMKCSSWEYDHSFYKRTIVDQWDLVCDREWMVSAAKTVYMLGFLFGSVINGQLSVGQVWPPEDIYFLLNLVPGIFFPHIVIYKHRHVSRLSIRLGFRNNVCLRQFNSHPVLPETPRWLLTHGKFKELERLLLYAAKKNNKDLPNAKLEIKNFIAHHSRTSHIA